MFEVVEVSGLDHAIQRVDVLPQEHVFATPSSGNLYVPAPISCQWVWFPVKKARKIPSHISVGSIYIGVMSRESNESLSALLTHECVC